MTASPYGGSIFYSDFLVMPRGRDDDGTALLIQNHARGEFPLGTWFGRGVVGVLTAGQFTRGWARVESGFGQRTYPT